ncbi:MBL fold metallo-hydrolase [Clostridium estertheticum]|nr:MBL fold metallo-hydrolase [Clostridium estertheticum]
MEIKMKVTRKKGKKVILYLLSILLVLCVGIILFLNLEPAFGGNPTKEQKNSYKQFSNYVNGKFVNDVPTSLAMSLSDNFSMIKETFSGAKDRKPDGVIPVSVIDWNKIKSDKDSVTWFGHSAFLLSIDNKKILLDPMLGPVASPVSFAGTKRYKYSENMLNIIDKMPPIDAVFISHDHYDHLDYQSIVKLKDKVAHFFVPLGVSDHLIRWGVPKEKITELNWWDEMDYQGLKVSLTPSLHYSGRGVFNKNSTLWGGWVILGKKTRLYYSGDGGYGEHFKKIGKKYGPFDITLLDGGQYDKLWPWVHMRPEEAVQANLDVSGKNMMLMHWGAFSLAYHGWNEPIERALKAAKKEDVNLFAPKIGENVRLDSDFHITPSPWWNSLK